jgi:hypothetical protein
VSNKKWLLNIESVESEVKIMKFTKTVGEISTSYEADNVEEVVALHNALNPNVITVSIPESDKAKLLDILAKDKHNGSNNKFMWSTY